ncbi:hypothetical protein [Burkholderia gladioli]|uniref:hypothetical protein n=1 Tax=Burkholderia gladioli TaxID=28095 RepID=UPI00163F0F29|nr:hypothetical protein [Burkholderia gladioli]
MADLSERLVDIESSLYLICGLMDTLIEAIPDDGSTGLPVLMVLRHIRDLMEPLPEAVDFVQTEVRRGQAA